MAMTTVCQSKTAAEEGGVPNGVGAGVWSGALEAEGEGVPAGAACRRVTLLVWLQALSANSVVIEPPKGFVALVGAISSPMA